MGYDEEKFREFNKMLKADDIDVCVIHHPQVLGDNYEELVENLNRLADSGKSLTIVKQEMR